MVLIAVFVVFQPFSAHAQSAEGQVVDEPVCFIVKNEAPYKAYGSFITNYFITAEGRRQRHKSNFRLEEAGAVHETEGYPLDIAEFCSYGPFYEGYKLDFVLRTLIPIFECRTRIDQGPIIISGYRKPEGGTVTTAACFD